MDFGFNNMNMRRRPRQMVFRRDDDDTSNKVQHHASQSTVQRNNQNINTRVAQQFDPVALENRLMKYVDKKLSENHNYFPTMYAVATRDITLYEDVHLRFPLDHVIKKDEILVLQNPFKLGEKNVFQTYFFSNLTTVQKGYVVGFDDIVSNVTNMSLIPVFPNRIDLVAI